VSGHNQTHLGQEIVQGREKKKKQAVLLHSLHLGPLADFNTFRKYVWVGPLSEASYKVMIAHVPAGVMQKANS
jgi:hypothetical protein